jgi:hypothetical protein
MRGGVVGSRFPISRMADVTDCEPRHPNFETSNPPALFLCSWGVLFWLLPFGMPV